MSAKRSLGHTCNSSPNQCVLYNGYTVLNVGLGCLVLVDMSHTGTERYDETGLVQNLPSLDFESTKTYILLPSWDVLFPRYIIKLE